MPSLLLSTMVRMLMPLILVFSVFVGVRGHHQPGGGFVGGLVAASAMILWMLSEGSEAVRTRFPVPPGRFCVVGLSGAVVAAALPMVAGFPLMTSLWLDLPLPGGRHVELGTTTLFDVGVYLTVVGAVLQFVFSLELRPGELGEED